MLGWTEAVTGGALGGLVTEVLALWTKVRDWQDARDAALTVNESRPDWRNHIDVPAHAIVGVIRAALGAAAGLLLRSEITGVYAAFAVGAAAPSLLAKLGDATTSRNSSAASPQADESSQLETS